MAQLNWPTWNDGKPVMVGERAISLRGPMTITSIEVGDGWYRLHTTLDRRDIIYDEDLAELDWGDNNFIDYTIDVGHFWSPEFPYDNHPYREGEECDFWPEPYEGGNR